MDEAEKRGGALAIMPNPDSEDMNQNASTLAPTRTNKITERGTPKGRFWGGNDSGKAINGSKRYEFNYFNKHYHLEVEADGTATWKREMIDVMKRRSWNPARPGRRWDVKLERTHSRYLNAKQARANLVENTSRSQHVGVSA